MPSPIGHSLLGILIYQILNRRASHYNFRELFLYVFIANLPDIDLALGFFVNDPSFYHQSIIHSFGAAVFAGLFISMLHLKKDMFLKTFLIFFGIYYSHVILDYLASASDTSYPYGVTLFWPLNQDLYVFPVMIFSDIWRGKTNETFFSGLFNYHNFEAVLIELAIFLPLIIIVYYFIFRKNS